MRLFSKCPGPAGAPALPNLARPGGQQTKLSSVSPRAASRGGFTAEETRRTLPPAPRPCASSRAHLTNAHRGFSREIYPRLANYPVSQLSRRQLRQESAPPTPALPTWHAQGGPLDGSLNGKWDGRLYQLKKIAALNFSLRRANQQPRSRTRGYATTTRPPQRDHHKLFSGTAVRFRG